MKRFFKRIYIKFLSNRTPSFTKEERSVIIIVNKLINDKSTEMNIHPNHQKYYIKSDDRKIWVVFELQPNEITIINHIYCYNIKLSERSTKCIESNLIDEISKRRDTMEKEFMQNIRHSLEIISKQI